MTAARPIRALCLLLALVAEASLLALAAPTPGKRAIWIWDAGVIARPKAVVETLRGEGVGTVFLFAAPRRLRSQPGRFSNFLAAAHAAGIKVQALNGEPQWVMPVGDADAHDFFTALAEFHRDAPAGRRFDAVHLDVEPYTLDEWDDPDKSEVPRRYLDFLRWTHEEAAKLGLPLAVDVPMLFEDVKLDDAPLMVHALRLADQVAIMGYEPGGDNVVERAARLLRAPGSGKAKVWIGISADPDHTKTHSRAKGRQRVEAGCRAAEALARRNRRVLGAAIHDYDHYAALVPRH